MTEKEISLHCKTCGLILRRKELKVGECKMCQDGLTGEERRKRKWQKK